MRATWIYSGALFAVGCLSTIAYADRCPHHYADHNRTGDTYTSAHSYTDADSNTYPFTDPVGDSYVAADSHADTKSSAKPYTDAYSNLAYSVVSLTRASQQTTTNEITIVD